MTDFGLPQVVVLSFDPVFRIGGLGVHWQAVVLAAVILVGLGVWVVELRRLVGPSLRLDDVVFVLLGAIPGAVIGGRVVYALGHLEGYLIDPGSAADLERGSLSLVGAVLGGALTAAYMCRMLGGRVGAWADAAAVPLLLVIGLGKLALVLGGGGLGAPYAGPGALAYTGDGPWWSSDPGTPAWPSQVLEGAWALLGIPVVWLAGDLLAHRRRVGTGLLLLVAMSWWLVGRALVAVTWRDGLLFGPWGAEGIGSLIALAFVIGILTLAARDVKPMDPERPPIRTG